MLRLGATAVVFAIAFAADLALAQVAPPVRPSRELIDAYVYGFDLMSDAERRRYSEQVHRVDSAEACAALVGQWQAELERRAAGRGKTLVPELSEFCKRRAAGLRNGGR